MADIKFKVVNSPDGLRVRTGAGTNFPKAGVPNLKNGSTHNATQTKTLSNGETWLNVSGGWCCQKKGSSTYAQITSSGSNSGSSPAGNSDIPLVEDMGDVDSPDSIKTGGGVSNDYYNKVGKRKDAIEAAIDGSMRMFGLPHQFIESADSRISTKSKLGRAFTETLVLEAPVIYIKPGTSKFLPNMTESQQRDFIATLKNLDGGDENKKKILGDALNQGKEGDPVKYFEFKPVYSDYMSRVNMLCRMLAVFLDIHKEKVPWVKTNVTFGTYDWRFYRFNSIYEDNQPNLKSQFQKDTSQGIGAFLKDTMEGLFMEDHEYLQMYVDAGASFSESASNSTRQSMVDGFLEQVEGMTKELQTLSGISGMNISDFATDTASDIDSFVQNWDSQGMMAQVFKRFTGNTKQIIAGGNMLLPEVWDSSDFNKSYSFTVHLSTPYGNKKSWFLNIGVPLMHILALALPHQLSPNVHKMPYLVKLFSPGWFSCEMGIIDNITIEKGGSGDAWALGGFATEYKISVSVKDLYSELGLPASYKPNAILNNTGLLEYLMVMCGMDLTHPGLTDKIKLIENLFKGTIKEAIIATPYEKYLGLKAYTRNILSITK